MTPTPQAMKSTRRSLRLNGEQSQRLLKIHRATVLECCEYWDWKLRDLGLVAIGPIPQTLKTAKERWLVAAWKRVQDMASSIENPSLAKIKKLEGLLNQMNHVSYRLDKKYSTLTKAGAELAANGRAVVFARDIAKQREDV